MLRYLAVFFGTIAAIAGVIDGFMILRLVWGVSSDSLRLIYIILAFSGLMTYFYALDHRLNRQGAGADL